ncbi:MAG: M15 family metallopeptidase, partial [Acidimicrobiales bacterium]
LAARVASTARARSGRGGTARVGAVTVTSVRGITVAASIADRLEALLAAAEADGFALGGSGYRSSDGQVAARRAHCGASDYDVYERPASSCRPPTARPGQSMHEQGLAVDFTWNGALITSRSNPAFQWLSRNAGRFGLYNLPAEPWHWSTNGN